MTHPELDHPWDRIRTELRQAVSDSAWVLWLEPLELRGMHDGVLLLAAPDRLRERVGERFGRLLHASAAAVLGAGWTVELASPEAPAEPVAPPRPEAAAAPPHTTAGTWLNPRYTFDQFVIGDGNRLAHAAALAVAEMPGIAYNPLYICGPPGLGKTHLLHSIGNYVAEHGAGVGVRYTTAEAFTNHFLGALHGGDVESFKQAYRGVDVLLVDDVQFLQSKARTEEEFFHTFNALHGAGAQIVLSSDRLPSDLASMEDRLRERFEAGLVCDVRPPDHNTRLAVLRKRAAQDGIPDPDPAALEAIAARVTTNLRALEGALIRVVAFASLTGRTLSAALTAEVLDGLYPELRPQRGAASVQDIQEEVAAAFGLTREDLLAPGRAAHVTWARQVAMYLAREITGQSLPAIGAAFGGRSHSTVLNACRRTAQRIAGDTAACDTVARLSKSLGAER